MPKKISPADKAKDKLAKELAAKVRKEVERQQDAEWLKCSQLVVRMRYTFRERNGQRLAPVITDHEFQEMTVCGFRKRSHTEIGNQRDFDDFHLSATSWRKSPLAFRH
jgi:hypothetical protein